MAAKSKKEKKKISGQSFAGILLYMMIGAGCGILIVRYLDHFAAGELTLGKMILLSCLLFVSVYAAMLIQIVIHEAGHLVFGLLTGYRFSSFRIFSLMWVKENEKLRFKRLSIAGTGGQCLMSPPDLKDGRMPFLLYNFGGAIMNLIFSAVFLALSFLIPEASSLRIFLQILALIGTAFAFMNGAPLHFGPVDNDGCNAVSMMHDDEAVRAFWIQMKANELLSKGIRIKDMPSEWFAVPADGSMKNSIIAAVGALACNRLMDEHRFSEADDLMEHLLSIDSGIIGLYRGMMVCDRIYLELIGENRPEVLSGMMTKEQKQLMKAMKKFPSVLRTEYAYALLSDKDTENARKIKAQFDRCASSYPYPVEIAGEAELIQEAYHISCAV